jgi:FeS assembly protein IscX
MSQANTDKPLYWDAIFEIVLALRARYPDEELEGLSLQMLFERVTALANFADDPALANDDILAAIYQEWFEENNPI